jgi:predicted SprT family Zn-dependent metalloprotease
MNDLIEREDAIEVAYQLRRKPNDEEWNWWLRSFNAIPSADRPQGHWTKTDVATYRCSECGKIQIADDINELNFCCCCGSRNKIRRMKGADDE